MKRNILLVCLFALIIVLFACSRSITDIYVSVDNPDMRLNLDFESITGIYVSVDNSDMCLKLDPDGTCSLELEKDGKHLSGKYEVEDNIITLEFSERWITTKSNTVTTMFKVGIVTEVKIYGSTITDDKGVRWVKQKKDN